ncbi:MAG: M20 family metallopeptidase [Thermomicrobiales bacterium]|nr:M20 family metallopeptidase [Thermomicrobiales bacterium]
MTQQWIDRVSKEIIVETARQLISIPSVSGDEYEVMQFVKSWLNERGISYVETANDPKRPNIIATIGNSSAGPLIAMNGHLDVVPISDAAMWMTDPFEGVVSEDGTTLYGRGASDMKSSVGVMLTMLDLFKDASLRGALTVHIVSDEETGAVYGTKYVVGEIEAGRLPRPDYVIVGEGSLFKIRIAERGGLAVRVHFKGRASHTAAARVTGINALQKAAKGILALEHHIDTFHPAVGYPVLSVNGITAGIAANVVPGEAVIDIDRRTVPGETVESVIADIRAKLDPIAAEDSDFVYELEYDPGQYTVANMTSADSPLVTALQSAVRQVRGQEPEFFVEWAGITDARLYRGIGIDTVIMGPGGENEHGANESIPTEELFTLGKIYAATISELLLS